MVTSIRRIMMEQEVVTTSVSGNGVAVADALCSQLKKDLSMYNAVIFFASVKYDFAELSAELHNRFPRAEILGTSTSGEISPDGFANGSVVLTTICCNKTKFSGVILDGVDKFPIVHKNAIEAAMAKNGIRPGDPESHKKSFAINFVNGLCNAEEAFLSLFYAIVGNDKFVVAGGSAGDDLKFQQTYVSYNGVTVSDGCALLFVTTELKFDIRKENIYKPCGKSIKITDADTKTRRVITINGRPAKPEYAAAIGVPVSQLDSAVLDHPFGRVFGDYIYISSIAGFNNDNTVNMYCRILKDSEVDLLVPDDWEAMGKATCKDIREAIPRPQFVLFINCILRTIYFGNLKAYEKITQNYNSQFPVWCGFSSYGEQFGQINSNQTLVSIVIGE